MSHVKKLLEERKKKADLSYVQQLTLDYAAKMTKCDDLKKVERVIERLQKECEIDEYYATKIIDIMPETPEEIRAIFNYSDKSFNPDFCNKILSILKEEFLKPSNDKSK